ncbi:ATP-binding cassette domain-containing protein [Enterococcus hulanensis]|uniref:ATP-binding cassette domain-containing protein n=1 Tax=Enterococcus hulanensis TaxID=2559929 RepID=UPI001A909B5A|nr:ATP-binding cassette domain-containing protein [Enterococcus hulanensis]MBO0457894.1 ATP-binding cassette domain-containing protein [Enterococcus hulanensis]
MTTMIEISEVSKLYKNEEVVSKVNMDIKKGEIYGFLGPNGAGKTTIMKMILNLVKPSTGEIRINRELIQRKSYKYLKKIGNIIETPVFYNQLTAKENLELHSEYNDRMSNAKIEEVLELVGLKSVGKKLVTEFSLGMRQRLGIARAILTDPEILILDEPINGLDPIGIKEIRELLLFLKNNHGMTILISSHIVSEIECIADTIGVINQGKLLREVQLSEIRANGTSQLELEIDNPEKAIDVLEEQFSNPEIKQIGKTLYLKTTEVDQSSVMQSLVRANLKILKIEQHQETLEEYFLNIIKGGESA